MTYVSGEYGVHVKFNDEHVPESPATLYIAPESGDAKKITLVGLRDRGLEVSQSWPRLVQLRAINVQIELWKAVKM